MSKSLRAKGLVTALAVILFWGGYRVFRAASKVVTLKVQAADVRDVVRQLERQTWETIPVHQEVAGKITLDVIDAPLPEVLNLIAQQAHARFQVLQPLFSSSASLDGFIQATRGDADPAKVGWAKLAYVIHPPLAPPPNQGPSPEPLITLQLTNRDLRLAGLAFSRLAQIQVVPEDGTPAEITLNLQAVSAKAAATALADAVHRQTKASFGLLPGLGPGVGPGGPGGPGPGGPGPGGPGPGGPGPGGPGDPSGLGRPGILPPNPEAGGGLRVGPPPPGGMSPPSRELRQQMEQDYQDLLAILPKAEAARLEAERQLQNVMENGLPDQKQEVGAQLGSLFQDRRQGLLQTSVAERVDQDRQKAEGHR